MSHEATAVATFLVDASVAIKWTAPEALETGADDARELIGRHELRTTALALHEVANTVGRKHPAKAAAAIESCALITAICGDPEPLTSDDLAVAARLAEEHALTFYDASYAAISLRTGDPLLSADRHLLGPGLAISVREALRLS